MKRKTLVVAVILIVVSSVATATFFLSSEEDGIFSNLVPFTEPGEPRYDYTTGATIIPVKDRDAEYNDITGDFRPKYPGMDEEDYENFFGELPPFPEDFFNIVSLIYEGKITDFQRIDESYWKQPEFYSGWYKSVNDSYINNDPKYWTPQGYGIFPLIKEVKAKVGTTIDVTAYLRTGFGTSSYQGLILRPYLPNESISLTGTVLFEQIEKAEQYIKPRIDEPDNAIYNEFKDNLTNNNIAESDWFVILEPTYQKIHKNGNETEIGFPYDWVKPFNLEIEIASSTPPGMYCVAIKPDTPCFSINQEFYLSREHEYYGSLYYPAGGILRTVTPHFQVMLEVVE
jgi:hypothetical protein